MDGVADVDSGGLVVENASMFGHAVRWLRSCTVLIDADCVESACAVGDFCQLILRVRFV